MAPILKDLEAPVAVANTTSPHAKPPADAPARTQPVALEIPVTVNGAHTVVGSDKREPFSETTNTVLVFPLGAVIRIATPLAPGQLIFLTNEKTKKEIVCQVVKSKSAGPTGTYVELQFTEPSPSFWGLQVPIAPVSPGASRPAVPSLSAALKAIPSAPKVAAIPVVPKPVVPAVIPAPPAKPVLLAPAPPVETPEPAAPQSIAPATPAPEIAIAPPPVEAEVPEPPPAQTVAPVEAVPQIDVVSAPPAPAQAATPEIPPAPVASSPMIPVLPLRDYSKAIDALFGEPQAPADQPPASATPEPNPVRDSSTPSTEDLKLHAARLQEQLSSLLFSESPAAPASPSEPPVTLTPEPPAAEVANKVLEIAQEEPAPVVKSEPIPAPLFQKPVLPSLSHEEEVSIPAWLAPLSQVSETSVTEPAVSGEVSTESGSAVSTNSEESYEALSVDAAHRSQVAVFGGQLLGESSAQTNPSSSTGSKKGLLLGIAAAALLVLGGAWYFRQNLTTSTSVTAAKSASAPASTLAAPHTALPAAAAAPTPAVNTGNSVPAASSPATSEPAKIAPPPAAPAVSASTSEPRNFNSTPASRNDAPVEPEKKSGLGDVHLATPVVNRTAYSEQSGDALPTIDASSATVGADPLAVIGSANRNEPAAPLPVGGDVKPAQLLKSVPPLYPPMARSQHISGNVQVDALIDASGNVAAVKLISGPPLLRSAALDAVKQWKYSPALLDGHPTAMHLVVTVQFRAQ